MKTYTIHVMKCKVLDASFGLGPQDVCDDCDCTDDVQPCNVQVEVVESPGCVGGDIRYLCPKCREEVGS